MTDILSKFQEQSNTIRRFIESEKDKLDKVKKEAEEAIEKEITLELEAAGYTIDTNKGSIVIYRKKYPFSSSNSYEDYKCMVGYPHVYIEGRDTSVGFEVIKKIQLIVLKHNIQKYSKSGYIDDMYLHPFSSVYVDYNNVEDFKTRHPIQNGTTKRQTT